MRRILIVSVIFVYMLLASTDAGIFGDEINNGVTRTRTDAVPVIQIEGASRFGQNQPLAFRFTISNSGSEPLYIYSTLLQNPQFTEIVIEPKQKAIEVRFSRVQTSPLIPYYFPPAVFSEITTNHPASFPVAFNRSIKELIGFETSNGTSKEARITPGRWTLRIMIGYGDDVSAVKLALASDTTGKEHPINEIVKWQRVAFSNSISIEVTK